MISRLLRVFVFAFVFVLFFASTGGAAEPGKISKEKISSREKERIYFLYVPKDVSPEQKLPLILTLHGSRRSGEALVSMWKDKTSFRSRRCKRLATP
jgi:poly(3-hydroxybutyrate) depolymerase